MEDFEKATHTGHHVECMQEFLPSHVHFWLTTFLIQLWSSAELPCYASGLYIARPFFGLYTHLRLELTRWVSRSAKYRYKNASSGHGGWGSEY